jgi:hypothetical protein
MPNRPLETLMTYIPTIHDQEGGGKTAADFFQEPKK